MDEYSLGWGCALSIHCRTLPVKMERLFEDVTVEEEQGLQRDILRGSRHLSLHRQIGQKSADFWGTHVRRVALMVEENKALGPWHIRLFRSDTQVFEA
jgi:hypothetical protein